MHWLILEIIINQSLTDSLLLLFTGNIAKRVAENGVNSNSLFGIPEARCPLACGIDKKYIEDREVMRVC